MQERTKLRIVRPPDQGIAERSTRPFTADQKRELFKGLVVASLDGGFLRYSRRQELIEIGRRLGFGEFEACLLIAEAQFRSGDIDPVDVGHYSDLQEPPAAAGLRISTQISLALLVAFAVDVAIISWLF